MIIPGYFYLFNSLNPDPPERRFSGVLHIPVSLLNIPQLLAKLFLLTLQFVHFFAVFNNHNTAVGYFNGEMRARLKSRLTQPFTF